jgi:excisionase family DNA binding protein
MGELARIDELVPERLADAIAAAVVDAVDRALPDRDRFISIPEAADRLGIHPDTARDWIAAGTFPVPVRNVGGRRKVSLRLLAAYVNAASDDQADALMKAAS